jgi:hypothetical protein
MRCRCTCPKRGVQSRCSLVVRILTACQTNGRLADGGQTRNHDPVFVRVRRRTPAPSSIVGPNLPASICSISFPTTRHDAAAVRRSRLSAFTRLVTRVYGFGFEPPQPTTPRSLSHCPRTVPKPLVLTGLELSLERKQMPQVVENVENECSGCNGWKGRFFAQGRCATRLRYAPTGIPSILARL